jgi:hypothetical protein
MFCFLTGPCFADKECRHPSNAINYGYICVLFAVVHLWIYIGGSLYTGMQQLKENLFKMTLFKIHAYYHKIFCILW